MIAFAQMCTFHFFMTPQKTGKFMGEELYVTDVSSNDQEQLLLFAVLEVFMISAPRSIRCSAG